MARMMTGDTRSGRCRQSADGENARGDNEKNVGKSQTCRGRCSSWGDARTSLSCRSEAVDESVTHVTPKRRFRSATLAQCQSRTLIVCVSLGCGISGNGTERSRCTDYLGERKQVQTLPLSVLSESRLGIDASHYLRGLLESPSTREPQLAATGGLPLALTAKIEADLRALEKLHIKPVFVFPGLLPANKLKPNPHAHADACKDRNAAWNAYEHGETAEATRLFESRANVSQWDLWRSVLRIFKQRNVDFIVAPYVAWAQVCFALTPI